MLNLIKKNESLINSIQNKNLKMVNFWITNGANINHIDEFGDTALMLAAINGYLKIINVLLANNANINHHNQAGDTALIEAASNGYSKIVNTLLANNANINHHNQYGDTSLIVATREGYSKIVNTLLVNNANINHHNQYGDTALIIATREGYSKIVNTLLVNNANINHHNQYGDTALMLAIQNNYPEITSIINKVSQLKKENLLHTKITINSITNILTKEKKWKNSKNMENEIIQIIDNYQLYLNTKLKNNNSKLNRILKEKFINNLKFEENYSLLHIAVLNDWQKLVTNLVNSWPVDIDFKDSSGNSAWNHACLLLQKENALLIKNKKNINEKDIKFLKEIIPLSKEWTIEKKKSNKIINKNRTEIFEYYLSKTETKDDTNNREYLKKESNSIDWQKQEITTKYHTTNTLKI